LYTANKATFAFHKAIGDRLVYQSPVWINCTKNYYNRFVLFRVIHDIKRGTLLRHSVYPREIRTIRMMRNALYSRTFPFALLLMISMIAYCYFSDIWPDFYPWFLQNVV